MLKKNSPPSKSSELDRVYIVAGIGILETFFIYIKNIYIYIFSIIEKLI